jgi:hypothetical protein
MRLLDIFSVRALEAPSIPGFVTLFLGLSALYAAGYLIHIAMLRNKQLKVRAELSATKIRLDTLLEEKKQPKTRQ